MLKLVNIIIKRAKMEDTMFLDFNSVSSLSSEFEELYAVRRDLASLLKSICKSCGAITIYTVLSGHLSQAVARFNAITEQDTSIEIYLEIECLLFCVTQLARTIHESQLSQIQDLILFVQKLIQAPQDNPNAKSTCDKYVAMRL